MSKIKDNGFLSGHIGGLVFREVNGKQVVQAMPSHYHDRNSEAQKKQRSGMRNVLAFYRILKGIVREQFEDAIPPKRTYDCFLHHNILLPPVDLPKKSYDIGHAIPAPYIVSHGSLPSLDIEAHDGCLQFQMKPEDWKRGDVLRLIKVKPKVGDSTCAEPSRSAIPTYHFASYADTIIDDVSNRMVTSEPLPPGAYTYVHLRNASRGKQVSTQQLIVINGSEECNI